MSNDIASLGIEIKTDSVKQAADDLDKLNQKGKESEGAADKAGDAWSKAAAKISGDTGKIVRELQLLNSKQDAAARVFQGIGTQIESASKSFQTAAAALGKYREESSKVGQAAGSVAPEIQKTTTVVQDQSEAFSALAAKIDPLITALGRLDFSALGAQINTASNSFQSAAFSIERYREEATRLNTTLSSVPANAAKTTSAVRQQSDALAELLGRIDPVVGALGRLDTMEESLRGFRLSGAIGAEDFAIYKAKIDAMRDSLDNADGKLRRTGVSAAQTAAALRMLPAQFTDIAVGLQSGQSPFTVLLQQGGQIKDQFGGIGPALASVGRYALALVNPFTLAAAAVGGLAAAVIASQADFNELNRALISTGNVTGKTAGQVMALANDIANGSHFAEASDAVLALAKNGQLTGEAFTAAARAATEFAAATGRDAGEIADKLSSAKGSVSDLAVEFNNQYGFMTKSTYDQIRALEEQGNRMEAVRVLSVSLAEEMGRRNKEMEDSTRGLAAAWDSVAKSVKGVWNEIKTGLSASKEEFNLQFLQGQLQDARGIGDPALIKGLEAQVAAAQRVVDERNKQREQLAEEGRKRKEIIDADNAWREAADQYLTKQQRKEKEIAQQRELGVKAGRSEADIAQRVAEIEAKYADPVRKKRTPKQPRERAYTDDAATRMLQSLREQGALLDSQLSGTDKLTAAKREQVKFEQLIADLKSKDILTADQKSLLANQDAIRIQLEKNSALDDEIVKRNELRTLQSFQGSLDQTLQSDSQGYEEQRAGEGLGKLQRQELRDRLRIQRDYQRQVFQLQTQQGNISQDLMDKESKALEENLNKRIDLNKEHYDELSKDQESFSKGASDAFSEFLDNARDIAGSTKNIIGDVLNGFSEGVGDSIGRAVVQGDNLQESLSGVAETISTQLISALVQLGIQYAINATLGQSAAAAATATSASMAAATATAWAPAAALASLASFGSNAAPAAAAITGTASLAESIAATSTLGGFRTGGYTGSGNPFDVAGVVHKGEYVMTADTVNRLGVDNLDAIQKGRSIASAVPAANDPSIGSSGRSGAPSSSKVTNINVNVTGIRDSADLRQASAKVARDVTGAVSSAERYR